jgi:hypothetical protein
MFNVTIHVSPFFNTKEHKETQTVTASPIINQTLYVSEAEGETPDQEMYSFLNEIAQTPELKRFLAPHLNLGHP